MADRLLHSQGQKQEPEQQQQPEQDQELDQEMAEPDPALLAELEAAMDAGEPKRKDPRCTFNAVLFATSLTSPST